LNFPTTDDLKERVKEATDIVALVGSYTQLRREGRGFKALCPWHADTRPSLQVNPERQSWKCWVCNLGGDVFSFVMQMENVAFPEALAMLADRAGIARERGGAPGGDHSPNKDEKRRLFQAMAWAEAEFHQCLASDAAAGVARKYLAERGISDASVERFRLGFAPQDWEWLIRRAEKQGISTGTLEKIGLVKRREKGPGHYDRFRGRVLFPIYDAQSRPVGIGGRVLPELDPGDTAKYINSPETPLYTKSKLLYGLHAARETIRKSGVALVMEGYTDTIVAHQCGFTGAVAVCGTALTTPQIRALAQCGPADRDARIVLVLDGDEAGRKRANEVLELFLAENADLRVLTLPGGADPCEFLLANGAEAFTQLIDTASDALSHAVATATNGIDLVRDVHAASRALDKLVETIAKAPRPDGRNEHMREQTFLSRLAGAFRVPEEHLRSRMSELRGRAKRPGVESIDTPAAPAPAPVRAADLDSADRELMEILLEHPECLPVLVEELTVDWLVSPISRQVVEQCFAWHMEGETIDFARLLLEFDDRQVKNLLVELDENARAKGAVEFNGRLKDVLEEFRRRENERQARSSVSAIRQGDLDFADQLRRLKEIEQQAKTRQGISAPMEG
jgi:DNA primase